MPNLHHSALTLAPALALCAACGGGSSTAPAPERHVGEPIRVPGAQPPSVAPDDPLPAHLAILGWGGRVAMAELRLSSGETVDAPISRCQDALLLVVEGAVEVEEAREDVIEAGRAFRAAAPRGARLRALEATRLFWAFVRDEAAPFRAAPDATILSRPPALPECSAPGAGPSRISLPTLSGPFSHAGGRLSVALLLDAEGQGAERGGLQVLDGDATVNVPEHEHPRSAEVLFFVSGSGTMRVGNEDRAIRPGTFVYVPPTTIHGYEPDGSTPLLAFQVYSPSGPEQRFRRAADVSDADASEDATEGDAPDASLRPGRALPPAEPSDPAESD